MKARGNYIRSTEAAEMVGGPAILRRLIETGRLRFYGAPGSTSLRSMSFTREDVIAAIAAAADAKQPEIYVVGFGSYVKIGFSRDVEERFLLLQSALPVDLIRYAKFPGTIADERKLHARFANLRLRGEWFQKRGRMLTWLEQGCPL